jgi:hypothetical protein
MDTNHLPVNKLGLDMENYRTVHQSNEVDAIHALIAIDTDWFWALMESLIDDGYLPTENIIVIRNGKKDIVKEGNRRVAALKLIHGHIPHKQFQLPSAIITKLAKLDKGWKAANQEVPCAIYDVRESPS